MASNDNFITSDEFREALASKQEIAPSAKWTDLIVGEIYKILKVDKKVSTFGACFLARIQPREGGKPIKIFLPQSLVDEIVELSLPDHRFYFLCLGVDVSRVNSRRKYLYDLVLRKEVGAVELGLGDGC